MDTKTDKKVFTDGQKVDHTVIGKTEKKPDVIIRVERRISSEKIGKEMASFIMGTILLDVDDLYDPKSQKFLTEDELVAKGAVFVTTYYDKILGDGELVKKSRITKEPTPYIRKTLVMQIIGNINWGSYINRRNDGNVDFIPKEKRTNGVMNFENCKAIGKTRAENFTINGVAFRVIEKARYYDENGQEYTNVDDLKDEFFKKTSKQEKKSKQREADKHGIELKFDPQYRTVRIDSCKKIGAFHFDYKPTDNINN